MRGKDGSMYRFDGYRREGEIVEYVLKDEKWSCDYRMDGVLLHEEATSEDGFVYEGTWGEPGESDSAKTIMLRRYSAKSGDILLIGEWYDGDQDAGGYFYQLPANPEDK